MSNKKKKKSKIDCDMEYSTSDAFRNMKNWQSEEKPKKDESGKKARED